jgi:hypothetical protein
MNHLGFLYDAGSTDHTKNGSAQEVKNYNAETLENRRFDVDIITRSENYLEIIVDSMVVLLELTKIYSQS